MDVFELLKKDHESVLSLFDELEQMEQKESKKKGSRQDKVFNQLKQELEVHTQGEEELLYPQLQDDEDLHPMILEAIEEHHVAKMLLGELGGMSEKNDQWFAKLTVLRENVEHHIDMEEGEIFVGAQEIMDSNQRKELGSRMAEFKEEHMVVSK